MGEMADYELERLEGDIDLYFDNTMYDEEQDCYYGPGRQNPICKFCGKSDLRWQKTIGRWILYEQNGKIHDCPKHPLPLSILKELAKKKMNTEITGTPFDNYTPPSWDEWFMKIMYLVASKSKDPKTKIGAVLVRDRRIISTGYNGLCRGVNDKIKERMVRPVKYSWFEHAERNSIYAAARYGIKTEGTIMFTNSVPCTDCARAVIQVGIVKVIIHKLYEDLSSESQKLKDRSQWVGHNEISMTMFREAGVTVEVFHPSVGAVAYFDGKQYPV